MFDGTEVDDAFADGHADPPPTLLAHAEDPIREIGVGEVAPLGHRDPRHLDRESECVEERGMGYGPLELDGRH